MSQTRTAEEEALRDAIRHMRSRSQLYEDKARQSDARGFDYWVGVAHGIGEAARDLERRLKDLHQ